jgi:hypothetical protein
MCRMIGASGGGLLYSWRGLHRLLRIGAVL